LYKFHTKFGTAIYLSGDIKNCLHKAYSKIHINGLTFQNGLEQGDVLSAFYYNLPLNYSVRTFRENQDGLKLNSIHSFLYLLVMDKKP
jgi:hypothetical protein